jgi:CubicO group peptidase (beta-lactamase class C family)
MLRPSIALRASPAGVLALAATVVLAQPSPPASSPQTLDEFRATAERVLVEHGIPGAGISLVRADGVEWEGGIGLADRDQKIPVTADTHFRAGSISKTFVAMALMQLYYDDRIDINGDVAAIASEVTINNPWQETHPVRVINLLQHTAGFDDMHFNGIYNVADPPDVPLLEVVKRSASSRNVRWPPGTRMSYSNPGYGVAGYLIEKVSGEPYEDYIKRIVLDPLKMTTSSFILTPEDEKGLAQGYRGATGPPTGFPQIYLRPAGNLQSSAREMGRFVRMLLNWGELEGEYVIDPEYLSNMERSSTTLAAGAGVRSGYGSGIAWLLSLPFPVLGHGGGIEGFTSSYGYSPSRDVGYVILLNSGAPAAGRAIDQLASLAIRYLKRDVDPPVKPESRVDPALLDTYQGYYQDANPRNQIVWPLQWFVSGRIVEREGDQLYMRGLTGERTRLIPVSEARFRRERELDATLVFTRDAGGTMVLTGAQVYAERVPRWRVEIVRWPVASAIVFLLTPLLVAVVWVARIRVAQPRGFWDLKGAMLLCPIALAAAAWAFATTTPREWATQNFATSIVFLASIALPTLSLVIAALAVAAFRRGASRMLVAYAWMVVMAAAGVSAYLQSHGLIGLRLWDY